MTGGGDGQRGERGGAGGAERRQPVGKTGDSSNLTSSNLTTGQTWDGKRGDVDGGEGGAEMMDDRLRGCEMAIKALQRRSRDPAGSALQSNTALEPFPASEEKMAPTPKGGEARVDRLDRQLTEVCELLQILEADQRKLEAQVSKVASRETEKASNVREGSRPNLNPRS